MTNTTLAEKIVSIRGRYLLIVMALLRNCSLVGIYNQVGFLQTLLLGAHTDYASDLNSPSKKTT